MIELKCLDEARRLWAVYNVLAPELVQEIQKFDWLDAEHEPGNLPHRRQIRITGQVKVFEKVMLELLPEINRKLGTEFKTMFGQWWLDLERFHCNLHTDGHLPNSMQIYWLAPGPEYGTGFYHYKSKDHLKHQFHSVANTGYLMLNHPEPDGSQPLQWHAMLNELKPGMVRLTSYHIFTL